MQLTRLEAMKHYLTRYQRILKYIAVGGMQFALDVVVFYALQLLSMPVVPANILSRLSAASAGYVANKHFTFSVPSAGTQGYRMVMKYWLFWLTMTAMSSGLLRLWESFFDTIGYVMLGKLVIDGGLCLIGFYISKKYIYTHAA